MPAYLYLIKMRILITLTYRFDMLISMGSNIIILSATIFLWKTAYSGMGPVNDLDLNHMITYTMISIFISALISTEVSSTIYNRIHEGDISIDLFRPVRLLLCYLAEDLGNTVSSLITKVLPLFIFASLCFLIPLPNSSLSLLLFAASFILSFGILWLLSAIVGLFAFWFMELGNMGIVKDSIVVVLSGSIVPIWFFPEGVQMVSRFLPFQYTYQSPIGIYIGVLTTKEALFTLLIQSVWIIILLICLLTLWKRAKLKTLIQGG